MMPSRTGSFLSPAALLRERTVACRGGRGFTFMAVLVAIVIIGISMSAAGRYWQYVKNREKEEELLFRGDQYRMAIERYVNAIPGRVQFPQNIDDLLQDDRRATARRHLRQKYLDPVTGEDFELIRDPAKGNRIVGVHSTSAKEPLRKKDFPDPYRSFEDKNQYSDWKFIYRTQQELAVQPTAPAPK